MVHGELHIHHYLVFGKSASDNAYSTPLRNEVCNVEHKMVMQGIDLCYNISLHICVKHHHYPENDTVCLSVHFISMNFVFICPD